MSERIIQSLRVIAKILLAILIFSSPYIVGAIMICYFDNISIRYFSLIDIWGIGLLYLVMAALFGTALYWMYRWIKWIITGTK